MINHQRFTRKTLVLALTTALLVTAGVALIIKPVSALDAVQAAYALDWWTVDNGGGELAGGQYHLNGTLGQPDAASLSGGIYSLEGGFWAGWPPFYPVYLPLMVR